MKGFFFNKWFYIGAGVGVVVVALVVFLSTRNGAVEYDFSTVTRGEVRQEISVTGKTKPVESVSLSFEQGGRVTAVSADVGSTVSKGQALVRLDVTSDYLDLRQAQASLAADKAVLLELSRGTRVEDMAILESKVSGARNSLSQSRQTLFDALEDSYTTADNAVYNYADQFFDNARSSDPQINITVNDVQLKINLGSLRRDVEALLSSWKNTSETLAVSDNLGVTVTKFRANLEKVKSLLDKLSSAVNALTPNQSLTSTTISTYRSNISTARTAVSAALSNLTTTDNGFSTALVALDLAEKNLALGYAGTAPEKIMAQEAKVSADEAKVASIEHLIAVSVLRSPIDGVVTKQDAKIGQVAVAGGPITSVISKGKLEIEAYVPEVDVGVMSVGNKTAFTFDAFPGEDFSGTISYIDPAETIIDGVPTYKTKLSLLVDDPRIRPGMTANLSVEVANHPRVLSVPARAIMGKNGDRYVYIQDVSGSYIKVPVFVGIRGINGEVEVLSGLSLGDIVAIPRVK